MYPDAPMIPTFTIDALLYGLVNDNAIIPPGPGALLVAHPSMDDPNFTRTVVLLIIHDGEDGTTGVVINRRGEPGDIIAGSPLVPWVVASAPPTIHFVGGPVQPDGVLCLRRDDSSSSGVVSVDLVDDFPDPSVPHRMFIGYAGWAPEQLRQEIAAGGWFVVPSEPGDVFDPDPATLWKRVLGRQSGEITRLRNYPEDPSLN